MEERTCGFEDMSVSIRLFDRSDERGFPSVSLFAQFSLWDRHTDIHSSGWNLAMSKNGFGNRLLRGK